MADTTTTTPSALGTASALFNAAVIPGRVAAQQQAGTTDAINAVNNIYGQTSSLTLPYATAGAAINNMLVDKTQPYLQAGQGATTALQGMQGQPLNVNKYLDPSMQFAMQQGQRALEASAAARGGVLSGATLKDITQYAQGLASQNYQTAMQNALADRNQQIGLSQGLQATGLQAMQPLSQIGQQGLNAVDIQARSGASTAENLATLKQNLGYQAATATAQSAAQQNAALNQLASYYGGNSGSTDYLISDERTKENIQSTNGQHEPASMLDLMFPSNQSRPPQATQYTSVGNNNMVQQTLDKLQPKQYNYTQQAQQAYGVPSGPQVGVMAQNLEQTPMKNMVQERSGVKTINIPQATNFALAAVSELNNRLNKMEGKA